MYSTILCLKILNTNLVTSLQSVQAPCLVEVSILAAPSASPFSYATQALFLTTASR
jgi:hypothetical protein